MVVLGREGKDNINGIFMEFPKARTQWDKLQIDK